jgi:hypothetical protein
MASVIHTSGMLCLKCPEGIYDHTPTKDGKVTCSKCGDTQPIKMNVKTFKQLAIENPLEYLYRIQNSLEGDEDSYHVVLLCFRYRVIERTPKGAWASFSNHDMLKDRFILLTAKKKYACRTKEEAKVDFEAKKRRQIWILKIQLDHAQRALRLSQQNGTIKECF